MFNDYYTVDISMGTSKQDIGPKSYLLAYFSSKEKALAFRAEIVSAHKEYNGIIKRVDNADIELLSEGTVAVDDFDLSISGLVVLVKSGQVEDEYNEFYVNTDEIDKYYAAISEMVKDDVDWSVSVRTVINYRHELWKFEDVIHSVKKFLKI